MSAETLKFFEDKTTEEIINWMLSNLSEDQIRSCLDQSGIPDTSVIKGKEPIASVGPDPIQPIQKKLQPGEGSSSDPLPEKPRSDITKTFLDKYRKNCNGKGYLIKSVSKDAGGSGRVEYYQFKEIEDGDTVVTPNVIVGDVGWVNKNVPVSEFRQFCTEDDREIFEFLKEENMDTFVGAPSEVIEVAADYPSSGLASPLPIIAPPIGITPEPTPVNPVSEEVQITEPMLRALKIQQKSQQVMSTNYPNLFSKNLTMFPIFVYGSDGDLVLHLTTTVEDGKLTFIKESTDRRVLNTSFRKITTAIKSKVEAGLYNPTENIREELNEALKNVSQDIRETIRTIYDPEKIERYTYFGNLDDEEPDWLKEAGQILPDSQENFNEDMLIVPKTISSTPKSKKVSDMTIPEIEERMRIQFGEQYVRDYKPEKYVNSLGVTNVRYVKRPNCPSEDKPVMVSRPIFSEFQGKPSLNSGPGRFGESDSDSDEDLLFD